MREFFGNQWDIHPKPIWETMNMLAKTDKIPGLKFIRFKKINHFYVHTSK